MLQGLKNLLKQKASKFIPPVPFFRENVLLIQAFPKKRTVSVTYKGTTKVGHFSDQTIRNMLAGRHFEKNTETFMGALAQLIQQLMK